MTELITYGSIAVMAILTVSALVVRYLERKHLKEQLDELREEKENTHSDVSVRVIKKSDRNGS